MTLYTLEVRGRAILLFPAEDDLEADTFAESRPVRQGLRVLRHNGAPIWDGRGGISARRADPAEVAGWEAAFLRALNEGDADSEDRKDWALFLVPVTDPTGRGWPEDADGDPLGGG